MSNMDDSSRSVTDGGGNAGRSLWRNRILLFVVLLVLVNVPVISSAQSKSRPTQPFRCSIKRPFPFGSQSILKLPENDFIDSRCVTFVSAPNFFEVNVCFEHKGSPEPKRIILAEIHLLDQEGKRIAEQTYKCPDARVSAGQEVAPGIRSSSLQSIDLSHSDKNFRDRVAEVEFVFNGFDRIISYTTLAN
jgi:hypothetical protein